MSADHGDMGREQVSGSDIGSVVGEPADTGRKIEGIVLPEEETEGFRRLRQKMFLQYELMVSLGFLTAGDNPYRFPAKKARLGPSDSRARELESEEAFGLWIKEIGGNQSNTQKFTEVYAQIEADPKKIALLINDPGVLIKEIIGLFTRRSDMPEQDEAASVAS